ncbi:MAG TPA: DUF222 domain-containing protein [Candidatus Dormibacteraeota bacterium]
MCDGIDEQPASLEALLLAAERLLTRADRPTDGPALAVAAPKLRHIIDLLELEFATLADLFESSGQWEDEGASSPENWIRHTCKMSAGAARTALVVGERAPALTESVEAVKSGRIGYGHLALMARTADWVTRAPSGDAPFDEQPLLQLAECHSVSRFQFDCAHARHAADQAKALRDHVDAVERRWLELEPLGADAVRISGVVDTVGAATLREALEPLAKREGKDDRRPRSRRMADALLELGTYVLNQGSLPKRASQRPHLQVTTTLETLRGLKGSPAAEMEFAGPVPAATAQRLACDAAVVRILLDSESALVDVGRARRTAPPATLRALRIRDDGCVWPGCERSAAWTTAHHVLEWVADHGKTETPNMVLLCFRHHWLVHEGGWQIARTDEGVIKVPPLSGYASPLSGPDVRPRRVRFADGDAALEEQRGMASESTTADG